MQKARFYKTLKDKIVKCVLCPHNCIIQEDKSGVCGVRKNKDGELYSLVYGKTIAWHVDPIEKKPLFHFYPGSRIYSFSTAGCNFKCDFCQNWDISQISKGKEGKIIGEDKSPKEIVQEALDSGCDSIAMTYNEPTIFFEYGYDTAKLAKEKGLKTVFVSNGYINKEPIDKISKYLDAINIDIKSFNNDFYKKTCGGKLKPVLDSIKHYHKNKVWVEVTTLIVPGENDSDSELKQIAEFISSVSKDIPWHISRFHPDYKMRDKDMTSQENLNKAYNIGKKVGLNYIYVGNIFGNKYESTHCPSCKKIVIERLGYRIIRNNLEKNKCQCGKEIKGKFI